MYLPLLLEDTKSTLQLMFHSHPARLMCSVIKFMLGMTSAVYEQLLTATINLDIFKFLQHISKFASLCMHN
jgi:hypothetical protein